MLTLNRLFTVFYTFVFALFLLPCRAVAQKEGNIWYFGYGAGLDFNGGSPVPLSDGAMQTMEGCATACDGQGRLLFYTNGEKVWTRTHQLMPNGTDLYGSVTSSQSALVVPKPCRPGHYYLFTTGAGAYAGGPGQRQLRVSEVDMSLNGGLGDVVEGSRNTLLQFPVAEKLAAVRHSNGRDYWVVARGQLTTRFHTYLVSPEGITAGPENHGVVVVSKDGGNPVDEVIGNMRFSHDGRYLASANYGTGIELLGFDPATGVLSGARMVGAPGKSYYGVEFSPNGQLLYASNGWYLYSFRFRPDPFTGFHTFVDEPPFPFPNPRNIAAGDMRLAPDGRIYMAYALGTALDVLPFPDSTAPVFVEDGLYLGGRLSAAGLPNPVAGYWLADPWWAVPPVLRVSGPDSLCAGEEAVFTVSGADGPVGWALPPGVVPVGGRYVTDQPEIRVRVAVGGSPGTVRAWDGDFCGQGADTLAVGVSGLLPSPAPPTGTVVACPGDATATFRSVGSPLVTAYHWSLPPGAVPASGGTVTKADSIVVILGQGFAGGEVTVALANRCGVGGASLPLHIVKGGLPDPGFRRECNTLVPTGEGARLSWYLDGMGLPGDTARIVGRGTYTLEASNACGTVALAAELSPVAPGFLSVPNAFSPNGDGVNDTFEVDAALLGCSLLVHNRWGGPVFRSDGYANDWDGGGLPAGAYFYELAHPCLEGGPLKGTVTIVR